MRLALPLLAAVLVLSVSACGRTSDEARIRETVAAMESALETRNPRDFMAHVAEDFAGQEAGFDRPSLHNLLRAQFLRNQSVGVLIGPIDIVIQAPRATATMTVTLSGGAGGLLPERGAIYEVETGWKQVGGDWQCISARWRQH